MFRCEGFLEMDGERKEKLITMIVFITIVIIVIAYEWSQRERYRPAMPGYAAPEFTALDLSGEERRLSEYRGKVVFLNIWATWCPPCKQEMPSMEYMYNKLKGPDFEILAVSIDREGSSVVKPFVRRLNLSFPILLDTEGKIAELYKITGVPETFIIDREGTIVEKVIGPRNWSDSKNLQKLKALMGKAPTEDAGKLKVKD